MIYDIPTLKHLYPDLYMKKQNYDLVLERFNGDEYRTNKWFTAPNKLIGGATPGEWNKRQPHRLNKIILKGES